RQYALAIVQAQLAAERDPDYVGWRLLVAIGQALEGRPQACLAMNIETVNAPAAAICRLRAGDTTAAVALADSLDREAEAGRLGVYPLGFLGAYHAEQGDAEGAIRWLSRAYQLSPTGFDRRLLATSLFDKV